KNVSFFGISRSKKFFLDFVKSVDRNMKTQFNQKKALKNLREKTNKYLLGEMRHKTIEQKSEKKKQNQLELRCLFLNFIFLKKHQIKCVKVKSW
ncbi:hypothetical protein RFI_35563, partial [Reticulomyxa filosa]